MKNIRNNLLNAAKFVFPAFSLQIIEDRELTSAGGYLCCLICMQFMTWM